MSLRESRKNKSKIQHIVQKVFAGSFFDAESNSGDDSLCAICLVRFVHAEEVVPLNCNETHAFHRNCIEAWVMKDKFTCPICRKEITFVLEEEDEDEDDDD